MASPKINGQKVKSMSIEKLQQLASTGEKKNRSKASAEIMRRQKL